MTLLRSYPRLRKKLFIVFPLALTSCVISNNSNSTFKRYLSKYEKQELALHGEIHKIHTSKYMNGRTHWTGPLKVRLSNGNYSFTSSGTWKGYYKSGEIFSVAKFDSIGQLQHEQIFGLEGLMYLEIIGYDESRGSETVKIEKLINYNPPLYQDTIAIEKFRVEGKKLIRDGTQKYYDEQGKVYKTVLYRNGKKVK